MNSNNCSDQNISFSVNLSLKDETLRMLIEMANDMCVSLEEVISSITEDSVIDLERLQDDLGIVIIPEKCSKQDLINSLQKILFFFLKSFWSRIFPSRNNTLSFQIFSSSFKNFSIKSPNAIYTKIT